MSSQIIGSLAIEQDQQRKTFTIESGQSYRIGRSAECHWYVPDRTVSRKHGIFTADENGLKFKSCGINGSLVNNQKILHTEWITLGHNAVVEIGSTRISVQLMAMEATLIMDKTQMIPHAFIPKVNDKRNNVQPVDKQPNVHPENTPADITQKPTSSFNANESSTAEGFWIQLKGKYLATPISRISLALLVFICVVFTIDGLDRLVNSTDAGASSTVTADAKPTNEIGSIGPGDSPNISSEVPDTTLQHVERLFYKAENLYKNRGIQETNLYQSIQEWYAGLSKLKPYRLGPSSSMYATAAQSLKIAEDQLTQAYAGWKQNLEISLHQENYKRAHDLAKDIQRHIPDIHDPRNQWAKKQQELLGAKIYDKR